MAKYLSKFRVRRLGRELSEKELVSFSLKDTLFTAAMLALAVILCIGLRRMNAGDAYVSMIFLLAVAVITSAMTTQIKRQEKQRYRAQVEEMRANLLRAVSHDLRTPLTSISGAASVLASQPDMPRDRHPNQTANGRQYGRV